MVILRLTNSMRFAFRAVKSCSRRHTIPSLLIGPRVGWVRSPERVTSEISGNDGIIPSFAIHCSCSAVHCNSFSGGTAFQSVSTFLLQTAHNHIPLVMLLRSSGNWDG